MWLDRDKAQLHKVKARFRYGTGPSLWYFHETTGGCLPPRNPMDYIIVLQSNEYDSVR